MSDENRARSFICRRTWTDKELLDLAIGVQTYGASETGKIAKYIMTKNEDEVRKYIEEKMNYFRKKYYAEKRDVLNRSKVSFAMFTMEEAKYWPRIRKWNRIAKGQAHKNTTIKRDYSKDIIPRLFQEFYEEAEGTTNPELVDVKAIYKFLWDCIEGKNPAELMPKESGIVLMLLKKLKEMKSNWDLDEEKKFISSFKKATKFVPIKVDDEAKEEEKEEVNEDYSGAVPIPQEVFDVFNKHFNLVRSFNPLMVPLWLLDKEQNYLFQMMQSTTDQ